MNKNTSIILIAAVAGIMIAGALAVTMTNAAFAFQFLQQNQQILQGANSGSGGNNGVNGDSHTDNGNHFGQDKTPNGFGAGTGGTGGKGA